MITKQPEMTRDEFIAEAERRGLRPGQPHSDTGVWVARDAKGEWVGYWDSRGAQWDDGASEGS